LYILTFDTSLDKTYICLLKEGKILESLVLNSAGERFHSSFLVSEIDSLLKRFDIKMKDVGAIGVNIGPASFTGLRVSLTLARVIAQQLEIPVVCVNSFEILSRILDKNALVVTDARRGKIYYANGSETPKLAPLDELSEIVRDKDFVCDENIYKILGRGVNYQAGNYPLGELLAQIVLEKLAGNEDWHWAKAKPLYIQPPPIHGRK